MSVKVASSLQQSSRTGTDAVLEGGRGAVTGEGEPATKSMRGEMWRVLIGCGVRVAVGFEMRRLCAGWEEVHACASVCFGVFG